MTALQRHRSVSTSREGDRPEPVSIHFVIAVIGRHTHMKGAIGAEKEHEYALGWLGPLPDFLRKRASCVGV